MDRNCMKSYHLLWVCLLPLPHYALGQELAQNKSPKSLDVTKVIDDYWPTSGNHIPVSQILVPNTKFNSPAQSGIERLSQYVSNTLVEDSSIQKRVVIRGQSSIDAGLNSPVGYILDDIPLPLGLRQAPELLNSYGIKIIKGAQGSFYGRNTPAGVLLVDSVQPKADLSGWGQYRYFQTDSTKGQEPGHQLQGGVTGGSETLMASIALEYQDQDSPYYNLYRQSNAENRNKRTHLQGSISYLPSDSTEILYRSHWQDKDLGRATMRYPTGFNATDRFTVNQNTPSGHNETFQLHSLRVDHELSSGTLTSITGYTDFSQYFVMDPDSSAMSMKSETKSKLTDTMISQEIRLSDQTENHIKWAIGSYFYQQDTLTDFTIGFTGIRRVTDNIQWGSAGFGHVQVSLNPDWAITAGVRVEYTRQEGQQTGVGVFKQVLSETEWLPKLVSDYQLNTEQSIYASWSIGYLPGGFNYGYSSNIDNFSYQAEHTQAFETGHRGDWLKGNIQTQVTFFYNRISDKQIVDIHPGLVQEITNAAKADIYGLESSVNWLVNDSWTLDATIGLQEGEVDNESVYDQTLPYTPDYTWSVGIDYAVTPSLATALQVRGSDDYYFDSANQLEQDAHELIDFDIRYSWGPTTVTFAVNNLLDVELYSRAVLTLPGALVEDTQARTASLTINYQW